MSKQQLRMVWPKDLLNQPPQFTIAEGYRLRTYRPGDEPVFFHLMSLAGFEDWDMNELLPWLKKVLPEGWFLIETRSKWTAGRYSNGGTQPNTILPLWRRIGMGGWTSRPHGKGAGDDSLCSCRDTAATWWL